MVISNIFQRGRSTTNQFKDHEISISSTYSYVISPYIKDHIHIFHRYNINMFHISFPYSYVISPYVIYLLYLISISSTESHGDQEKNIHAEVDRVHPRQKRRFFSCLVDGRCAEEPGGRRKAREPGTGVGGWGILEDGWKWWNIPGYNDGTWGLCVLFFSKSVGETRPCGTQHRSI